MRDKAGQSATIPNAIFKAMGPPGSPSIERDLAATGIAATQIRRMNLNESPYPPSAQAIAAMQAACSTVNYYPDPKWRDLVAAISGETGIAGNRIVLGNGLKKEHVPGMRFRAIPVWAPQLREIFFRLKHKFGRYQV